MSAGRGGAGGMYDLKGAVMKDPISPPASDLPKPLSDHTASKWGGIIYIAGGCDSPNGNEYNAEGGFFACNSISDSFYSFDPSKFIDQFIILPSLPSPRYRHSSVAVNNEIWIVGGRDVNDNLLTTVDVSISFSSLRGCRSQNVSLF